MVRQNQLEDAHQKINFYVQSLTIKLQSQNSSKIAVDSASPVTKKKDSEIQKLEEQVQHLTRTLKDKENELKEKAKRTSESRGHFRRTIVTVNPTRFHRRFESAKNLNRDQLSSWMGRGVPQ